MQFGACRINVRAGMRFPAPLFTFLCIGLWLPAGVGAVCAQSPKAGGTVPVVAEIIYAPTDFAKLRPRLNHRVVIEGVGVTKETVPAPDDWLGALRSFATSVCHRSGAVSCVARTQVVAW